MQQPIHHVSLFFFFILLFSFPNYSQSLTTYDERAILLSLKQHWRNPSSLDQWNSTSSPCHWPEISCNFNGSVTQISLHGMYIEESFPSTIFCQLNSLSSINLWSNNLWGAIPASLSSCSKLETLDLSTNHLNGKIPGELFSMKALRSLTLSKNNLSGEIPTPMVAYSLEYLDLSDNRLNGSIPEDIGNLYNLGYLDLSRNSLSGSIPARLLRLHQLFYLSLASNNLTLVFSFNSFVGGLPESLSTLINLKTLDLSYNNISGLIPSWICKHPKNSLKVLYLQNNLFTGAIPESLSNCSQLESLDLSFNYLKGKILSSLGSLLKLKDLKLWLNELEGEIPWELMYLQSLENLILDFNYLSGSIPETLNNCTNLKRVSLSDNLLSGAIPASLGGLSNLVVLKLGNNSISGNIPAELGNCGSLLWLDLNTNFLNGSIPPALFNKTEETQIFSWKHFVYIRNDGSEQCQRAGNILEFGRITGDRLARISTRHPCNFTRVYKGTPPTFNYGSMIFLDISYNKLEGSIPNELGYMYYLNLGHNDLSGPIPQELGYSTNFVILDLSHNRLNGSIPQTLTNLVFLDDIDLSNNHLSGMIPEFAHSDRFPVDRFANNSGLCGYPLPQCGLESKSSSSSKPSISRKKKYIVITCSAIAGVLIVLVIMIVAFRHAVKRRKENNGEEWSIISFQRLEFNKWEILGGLTDENLIGNGGLGKVYKVITKKGQRVAVKSIWHERKQNHTLEKQFLAEAQILGRIWHYNIVKLLCCIRGKSTKLIVYEYIDKQCLHKWLHGKKRGLTTQVLHWETRLKIAIGAAQGLCYMHHSCNPPIVHRDIKSSNILVDIDFNAKIADFGLAKMLVSEEDPETASAVVGTFGYIAPEYGNTRRVNAKSDIYSFGVVLLELTTGREAVSADEDMNLAQWAHKHQREGNSIVDALDEDIKDPCYLESTTANFKLGLVCTLSSPSSRPSMKDILQILQRCSENNHL